MCGLIGILTKESRGFFTKDADIFQQMLYSDALRGWDATGVFGVNKHGNIDVMKKAVAAGPFMLHKKFEDFKKEIISKYHIVIGHNRKATHGEKKDRDAHPFWSKNEKIVLVHNGMISNHKKFCDVSTVDSEAITEAFSTKEPEEIIPEIDGAFAFIWYNTDEKKLYFIRNEARPLFICETSDLYVLVSEPEMANWILSRNNTKLTNYSKVKEHVMYCYDLESRKISEVKEIEKKKVMVIHTPTGVPTVRGESTTNQTKEIIDFTNLAPETEFYSTVDFKTPNDVVKKIKHNDVVCITIDSYDEIVSSRSNSPSYKVMGRLINVDHKWISTTMYVSKILFDDLDITKVLEVHVLSVSVNKNYVEIFVNRPEEQSYETTENNMIITENMWMDDKTPMECDTCNDTISYRRLADTAIYIEGGKVSAVYCPKCLGIDHDKTSSTSPV